MNTSTVLMGAEYSTQQGCNTRLCCMKPILTLRQSLDQNNRAGIAVVGETQPAEEHISDI
ncbi:MAG: hypothetical protein JNM43_20260 [Planctomycetaceae bacterium]|nr:hypothetical protein [Planctomycetaceae bacterium]